MCAVKERFVEKPNLPESKVTTAAVSGAYPEILEALKAHGIRCVTTEFDTRLPDPIAYHADMQMLQICRCFIWIRDARLFCAEKRHSKSSLRISAIR